CPRRPCPLGERPGAQGWAQQLPVGGPEWRAPTPASSATPPPDRESPCARCGGFSSVDPATLSYLGHALGAARQAPRRPRDRAVATRDSASCCAAGPRGAAPARIRRRGERVRSSQGDCTASPFDMYDAIVVSSGPA